jgi:lipopolysaccharide export system ATP-binding protein
MELIAANIEKEYKARSVVKKASFKINSGEIISLLGPNGAGKTTCFYMLLGLVPVDSGSIYLDNQEITNLPVHKRAQLGISYLPQESSIFRGMSVKNNIFSVLELQQELSKTQRLEKLEQLLNEFNLNHITETLGMSLSGGERRRVEIARALAVNPRFILLDEPFAGVDPKSIIDIKHLIKYLANKQIGILITDHNVRDTLDICQKAYIINNGQVICSGEPQQIALDPQVREVYLGSDFKF